jgi:hypothetical protein
LITFRVFRSIYEQLFVETSEGHGQTFYQSIRKLEDDAPEFRLKK